MKTLRIRLGLILSLAAVLMLGEGAWAQPAPAAQVREVELQPFGAQVRRVIEAMGYLGEPFSATEKKALEEALISRDGDAVERIQTILDAHVLFVVNINPE